MKKYLFPIKWYMVGNVFFLILSGIALAFLPIASMMLFDTLAGQASHSYILIITVFISCVVLDIVGGYGSMRMTWGSAIGFEIALKRSFMRSILLKPYTKFIKKDLGEYISFIGNDIATLETDYLPPLMGMVTTLLSFIIYFLVIFILVDWRVAILLLAVSIASVMLTKLSTRTLGDARAKFLEAQGKYTESVRDILEGRRLVTPRTYENILSQHEENLKTTGAKRLAYGKRKTMTLMLSGVFAYSINVAAFVYIAYLLFNGSISVGEGVAAIAYIEAFSQPLDDIMYNFTALRSVRDTRKIFLAETEALNNTSNSTRSVTTFAGSLKCIDLTVSHEDFAVKSFNFTFERGKKYAIVGSNGSGKSTLLDALAKFSKDYEGSILLDDIDIRAVDVSNVIAYQSQAEHVYSTDYASNVTVFGSYALEKNKLDDLINENIKQSLNCTDLSGGEQQIVSFVRTINANTPIVLLDEPFSAVDENSLNSLVALITSLDKTVIMVTHDLTETLSLFDAVLIMDNGKLKTSGSYDTIKSSDDFRKLVNTR